MKNKPIAIYLKQPLILIKALWQDIQRGDLNLRAMSLVYTTLLSLVPLLALSFSVLKSFGVHNQIETLLLSFLEPLGTQAAEISRRILQFVDNMQVGVLGTLGLIVLLYTVISLMQKIEEAFNLTWRVETSRNLGERFSHYLSALVIGPVLMFSAFGLWASFVTTGFVQDLMQVQYIGSLLGELIHLAPKMLIIFAFTFVYIFIPNVKVKFHAAFIGAIISGLLWQFTGWIFASFIVNSTQQIAIYSVFATLFFFMLWMYIGWLILLIGSSIAFYIQNPEYMQYRDKNFSLSNQSKEILAVAIMRTIAKNAYAKQPPLSLLKIKQQLNLPTEIILEVINILQYHHIVVKNDAKPSAYLSLFPLDETKISDVIKAIYMGNATQNKLGKKIQQQFPDIVKLLQITEQKEKLTFKVLS